MAPTTAAKTPSTCSPKIIIPTSEVIINNCTHCGFSLKRPANSLNSPATFCCYGCAFAHQIITGGVEGETVSWILVKLGVAAFLAMNVMGFALALHSSSIYPDFYINLGQGGRAYDELLRYLLLFMSAPVLFLIGVPLYENIYQEIRNKRWSVEGFIGVSVLAAFGYSVGNTLRASGPVYYDIAVMVLVFLTLGRYLEARFRFKASQSLERLLEEEKIFANRFAGNVESKIIAEALRVGDEIILRSGEKVPVDGIIESGCGVVEMASMTGEFLPITKMIGDTVWSGALLNEGFLRVRVTHLVKDSWLSNLRQTLQKARNSKAPIELFADRAVFFITLLTIAAATAAFILGFHSKGVMEGLLRALSVFVIVCPCALGAAIPLALWKTFQAIVSQGILFKDLSRLETLSKINGVFFDKTGTLTEPEPNLKNIEILNGASITDILSKAASLAQTSLHPFSKAIVRAAKAKPEVNLHMPQEISTVVGQGVCGMFPEIGWVFLGNLNWLKSHQVDLSSLRPEKIENACTFLAWNHKLQAMITFEEKVRAEVNQMLQQLRDQRLTLGVLTGDVSQTATQLMSSLGVECISGLSPLEKHEWIQRWEKKHGGVLVVGEGLNDAPMLAGAGVSLAIEGALDKVRETADFVLPDNDLSRIPWLIQMARATMRKIRGNLFWAFFYNLLAIPFAVFGKINPVLAALIMILSSVFIIAHSFYQKFKKLNQK